VLEQHKLFRCPVFQGYDVARRHRYIRDQKGCLNCLGTGHKASECNSTYTCRECRAKHHSLFHRAPNPPTTAPTTTTTSLMSINTPDAEISSTETQSPPQVTFLATVMVNTVNGARESVARAALDTGATSSLVTEALAARLKLKRYPRRLTIAGACGGFVSKHFVELTLQSTLDTVSSITIKFNVVKSLPSAPAPTNKEDIKEEAHLRGLPLADPNFGGQLDILLGGLDYDKSVLGSRSRATNSNISAQPTVFGWSVTGPLDHTTTSASVFQIKTEEDPQHNYLARLWELD